METVSFATARRGIDHDTIALARKYLSKGYGYQNAARLTGVCETDLRQLCGAAVRRESVAVPRTGARTKTAARRPDPQISLCAAATAEIIREVARRYGFGWAAFVGHGRRGRIGIARQEAMWRVRHERPHLSYPAIARIMGGRDHTTIMHGVAVHSARMAWIEVLRAITPADDCQPDLFEVAA